MPRTKKVKESVETTEPVEEPKPLSATRDDYIKARAVIQLYRENQKQRPKRKCSEKQLEALAAGRAKNSRTKKKEPEQNA